MASLGSIDLSRTCSDPRFDSHFSFFEQFKSFEDCGGQIPNLQLDLERLTSHRDFRRLPARFWWLYWTMYMKGYLEFERTGTLDEQNPYFQYLQNHFFPLGQDPGLAPISASDISAIVARRYSDFGALRRGRAQGETQPTVEPARIITTRPFVEAGRPLFIAGVTEPLRIRYFDGGHRLFMARLCGFEALSSTIETEPEPKAQLFGEIEQFTLRNGVFKMRGWALAIEQPIDVFELRANEQTYCIGAARERADVQARHPQLVHAGRSGFEFQVAGNREDVPEAIFELVGLWAWRPIGKMRVGVTSDLDA